MQEYRIPKPLLEKLLGYLASKPYIEVHEVVPVLQALEEITCEEADTDG